MKTYSRFKFIFPAGTVLILMLLASAIFVGCEDFVEVDLPSSQLTAPSVFNDVSTADAAVADIMAKLRDSGMLSGGAEGLSHQMGNYTDELQFYGNSASNSYNFYTNVLLSGNRNVGDWWRLAYSAIYASNAVYEGTGSATSLSDSDVQRLQGEALYIRSLLHFYLVNLYGSIPYIKTTDYAQNMNASKLEISEVYNQIKSDLLFAVANLPEAYPSEFRTRPNKAAAQALLARVYLYTSDWPNASLYAGMVIENASFTLESPADTFKKESRSTILQFSAAVPGGNTREAATFTFVSGPPPLSALRPMLLSSFEQGDARREAWISEITNGEQSWYFASKYKENQNTGTSVEYSIVQRLSEIYLIRSEARAMMGDIQSAAEDLNRVRTNAGLSAINPTTPEILAVALLRERQVELFTEFGHRFFDLKRLGLLDATLQGIKPSWASFKNKLPLPQAELLLNPNLAPQNEGYN